MSSSISHHNCHRIIVVNRRIVQHNRRAAALLCATKRTAYVGSSAALASIAMANDAKIAMRLLLVKHGAKRAVRTVCAANVFLERIRRMVNVLNVMEQHLGLMD